MKNTVLLKLAKSGLVLMMVLSGSIAMAQYTGEFVICTDGSSPDNCRGSQIPPDPNTGIVTWSRGLGSTLCVGVGIVPQDSDCTFLGDSYNGFDCQRVQDVFGARVSAGVDMAIACGD